MNTFLLYLCMVVVTISTLWILLYENRKGMVLQEPEPDEKKIAPYIHISTRGFVTVNPKVFDFYPYPKGAKINFSPLDEEILAGMSKYTIFNSLELVANETVELEVRDNRRRYMTALSMLYSFEIPYALLLVDVSTRKLFEHIGSSMVAHPVTLDLADRDFPMHLMHTEAGQSLNNGAIGYASRQRLYVRHYQTVASFIVQTLQQQSTGMILPFYATFEKKLRENMHRKVGAHIYTSDELRATITAVAVKLGLWLPASYVLHSPLTTILLTTDAPPDNILNFFRKMKS